MLLFPQSQPLSPTDERRDHDTSFQDLEQIFATKDFVMEPDVFSHIRRYIIILSFIRDCTEIVVGITIVYDS